MNPTVTRFGNMPPAGMPAAPVGAPMTPMAPQGPAAALMAPAQDVASFGPQQAPAPMAGGGAPAIKFEGKLWDSAKGFFTANKDNAAATFDVKAARAKLKAELKQRELLPQRIAEEKKNLGTKVTKLKQLLNQRNGAREVAKADLAEVQGKIDGLNEHNKTRMRQILDIRKELEAGDLDEARETELQDLQLAALQDVKDTKDKIQGLQPSLKHKQQIFEQRDQVVRMLMLQVKAVQKRIQEGQLKLDEALRAFEQAKEYEAALEALESAEGISSSGEVSETEKLFMQAFQMMGEKKMALEQHLDEPVEAFVEREERAAETEAKLSERDAYADIEADLAALLAAEDSGEEEAAAVKTKTAGQ